MWNGGMLDLARCCGPGYGRLRMEKSRGRRGYTSVVIFGFEKQCRSGHIIETASHGLEFDVIEGINTLHTRQCTSSTLLWGYKV